MKLRGVVPSSNINVSASDLYVSWIGLSILLHQVGEPLVGIYKSLPDTCMWKLRTSPRSSFLGTHKSAYLCSVQDESGSALSSLVKCVMH
jgi:hypothetical protein